MDTELEQLSKTDRNPSQESRYRELLSQQRLPYFQGGNLSSTEQFRSFAGGGGGLGAAFDPLETARQLRQFNVEANQPQISSLQASIPETQARFGAERTRLTGEKEPLKQRYQSIIDELTRQETVKTSEESGRLSREFGRRGVPLASGVFEQDLAKTLTPYQQYYTGQRTQAGLERETGLRGIEQLISGLSGQETDITRQIQNSIALLQSGNPLESIQGALSLIQLQQQGAQNQSQNALAQQQLTLAEREQGLKYAPDLNADLTRKLLEAQLANANRTPGTGISSLTTQLNPEPKPIGPPSPTQAQRAQMPGSRESVDAAARALGIDNSAYNKRAQESALLQLLSNTGKVNFNYRYGL